MAISGIAKTLPARVLQHIDEIVEARARGLGWKQILDQVGPAIGLDPAASRAESLLRQACERARRQIEKGRLRPPASADAGRPNTLAPAARTRGGPGPAPAPAGQTDLSNRFAIQRLIKQEKD